MKLYNNLKVIIKIIARKFHYFLLDVKWLENITFPFKCTITKTVIVEEDLYKHRVLE